MDSTKLKVFADDVVHIMVSVLLKIKNMVGKRENAGFSSIYSFLVNVLNALLRPLALSLIHYFETVPHLSHFAFFQNVFLKAFSLLCFLFPKQALVITCLQYKSFENTAGKGKIARNEQFFLFPQCFLPIWKTFFYFHQIRNCRLQTLSFWKSLKFVVWERVKMSIYRGKSRYCVVNISSQYTIVKLV